MLSVIMLNVVMLIVFMMSVVAPTSCLWQKVRYGKVAYLELS